MIKSIFFDIDGTLVSHGRLLPGAVEAVACARNHALTPRFLTNISGRSPSTIAAELQKLGLAIESNEIQTATTTCIEYLKSRPGVTCHFIVPANILSLFDEISIDNRNPDVVVIGDIGDKFNFEILNRAFLMLRAGAELIAIQKGLFWYDLDGPKLDCGSFIIGLEAASGQEAILTGKPSTLFFQRALDHVGCRFDEVLVIGDDISTDVRGAARIGSISALVGTGKYLQGTERNNTDQPDYFLPTLEHLPRLIEQLV
jgi:HAD superfamily hydrolase (TIGR01458 family)